MRKLPRNLKLWKAVSTAFNLGMSISLPIAGGAILGMFLDEKFNTHPRLTLSLLFTGVFAAAGVIYRVIKETKE